MQPQRQRKTSFLILFGSFLLVFIGIGVSINTAGVFIEAVSRSRGFSTASVTFIFSVGALVNMAGAVIVGNLLNRYDHRPVMAVSILLLGGGMSLYAVCEQIWQFYLVALLTGSGTAGSHLIPASMFVTRWFGRRRGLAMGLVLAGNGLGGLVFNPLARFLMEANPFGFDYGYRSAYVLGGLIIVAVLLPTAMLLRLPRSGEGELPSGDGSHRASLGQALRITHYWFLAASMLGISAVFMGINQHIYGYLVLTLGIEPLLSSRLVGFMMGMTVPGILIAGALNDKIGTRYAFLLFGGLLFAAISLLPLAETLSVLVLCILLYGFFNVLQTVFPPLMVSGRFGESHYPAVFGSLIVAQTLGAAFGPFIIGLIFDAKGSYVPAILLSSIVLALSVGLGSVVAIPRQNNGDMIEWKCGRV
jgi:MFS family permease